MNGNQSPIKATVLCIGDPVLDIIACESPQGLLERFGYSAGGSDVIDEDELEKCLKEIEIVARIPGGSAANVAKCLAGLSSCSTVAERPDHIEPSEDNDCVSVNFSGTLGSDQNGQEYVSAMVSCGVRMEYASIDQTRGNGVCLCLVGPDGQRTMRTCLRASMNHTLSEQEIHELRPTWTHFEGYYVHKSSTIVDTMRHLKDTGSKISFDFASFDVVKGFIELFLQILEDKLIDLLFCNEFEALEFASLIGRDAQGVSRKITSDFITYMVERYQFTMVVSRGDQGCLAGALDTSSPAHTAYIVSSHADKVNVVDTIGAGDHFSAAFLYSLIRHAPSRMHADVRAWQEHWLFNSREPNLQRRHGTAQM
eukprot:jgi/Picre1/33949/NNA_001427.t1